MGERVRLVCQGIEFISDPPGIGIRDLFERSFGAR
jgi:hypothetical protein